MALTDLELTVLEKAIAVGFTKANLPLNSTFNKFSASEGSSVTFPIVTALSDVQENATDYTANSDSTGSGKVVELTELSQTVKITPEDRRNGWSIDKVFESAALNLALAAHKHILKALPAASETIVSADNFDPKAFAKLQADVDAVNLSAILTPSYFVNVLPTQTIDLGVSNGAYGYNDITRATTKIMPTGTVACVYQDNAIAVGSALPYVVEAGQSFYDFTMSELSGLTVRAVTFSDPGKNTEYLSLRIMLAASVADASLVKTYSV